MWLVYLLHYFRRVHEYHHDPKQWMRNKISIEIVLRLLEEDFLVESIDKMDTSMISDHSNGLNLMHDQIHEKRLNESCNQIHRTYTKEKKRSDKSIRNKELYRLICPFFC